MSPDDHYQDMKRIISTAMTSARRLNVIMPFLYESRQHLRSGRESLACALALQEPTAMGAENIITFDAHDPRVQNAIPLLGFESVMPAYQFIKAIVENEKDLHFDKDHMMMISPDEGAMRRVVYFASILGLNAGMFYKRRDYTRIEDGRNPIIAHEFLGQDLEGMDAILVDDMISSGDSVLEVARELKARKCGRLFVFATFGLFTNGLEKFDRACEEGLIDRIYTTNLIYQMPELADRGWYVSVDMSRYIALLIDTLNHNDSISGLLDPSERIHELIGK